MRKFKEAYKQSAKLKYKSKTVPDLNILFKQSELKKAAMMNGARVLDEAINTTTERVILQLKVDPMV